MAQLRPRKNDPQDRRLLFDQELRALQIEHLGYQHTYFHPTEKTRMQYDAMVYTFSDMDVKRANNKTYNIRQGYSVIWISKDPETPLPFAIQEHFERCSPGKSYVAENLYHFPFTIFY